MNKNNILVVGQYFYPEQFRINDICTQWVKRGYNVNVVTGIPNYPKGKFYEGYGVRKKRQEIYNGINIKRIPQIPRGNNSVMLALNYISFVVSGFFWKSLTKEKPDLIFNYETSPITQALPGIWLAKNRNIPFFIYITDLWPDNLQVVTGIESKIIIKPIEKICNYIYKNSDKIFTSSETFLNTLKLRGVPEEKLYFWPQYAEDFYKVIEKENANVNEIPQDGKFNIVFAGNIGFAQGLEILPKTAELLKNENLTDVRFCIIGDGRYKDTLLKHIKERNVDDYFYFIEKQPVERIPEFMSVCNAALICLAKSEVFSMTIPSKLQSCMACGIPLIASIDGETQDIIQKSGAGFYCNAADYNGLYEIIKKMINIPKEELYQMGKNARQFFEENYEREILLNKMDSFINDEEVFSEVK